MRWSNFTAMRKVWIVPLVVFAIFSSQCKKDQNDRVPNVPVDITINISLPSYNALSVTGGFVYVTGGSNGILVYRASEDEFAALDRHCTYDVPEYHRVTVDSTNIIASDQPGCGSGFIITDGSVVRGPAFVPLTRYDATYNATTQLVRIFN
jgi:nitrite reductase/ring-hydroxylating ferredoxin subunit